VRDATVRRLGMLVLLRPTGTVRADMTLTGPKANVKVTGVLNFRKLECGPMPNMMTTLPNIGGAIDLFNAAKFG